MKGRGNRRVRVGVETKIPRGIPVSFTSCREDSNKDMVERLRVLQVTLLGAREEEVLHCYVGDTTGFAHSWFAKRTRRG